MAIFYSLYISNIENLEILKNPQITHSELFQVSINKNKQYLYFNNIIWEFDAVIIFRLHNNMYDVFLQKKACFLSCLEIIKSSQFSDCIFAFCGERPLLYIKQQNLFINRILDLWNQETIKLFQALDYQEIQEYGEVDYL